jgi:hypothetical protein
LTLAWAAERLLIFFPISLEKEFEEININCPGKKKL